jgi:actin-like ATPase involved in cell morphogenesis
MIMPVGFDAGTYNLVCCRRNDKGEFLYRREVNAFLEMPLENKFVYNMMKKAGVPLILREDVNVAYAIGEAAVEMAYTMPQIELRRPMKDGCVNPKERDAFQILNIMAHSLIGDISEDKTTLYYSVPANAVNTETDADYHRKILDAIFKAYKSKDGFIVNAHPINEALALIYAELANKAFTGIGISFGAGMVNLCYSIFAAPVFQFSLVNSGDWIDKQAAKALGESVAFVNKEKTKIDLGKEPTNNTERAIGTQYKLMIEKTVAGIKKGLEESKKGHTAEAVDVVIAGGTSSPPGFDRLFETVLREAELPINIGKVIRPADPLYSVARGCLVAAENANV